MRFAPFLALALTFAVRPLGAATADLDDARKSYQTTDYKKVIAKLTALEPKDRAAWQLLGQAHFMATDHKKAIEIFEKAVAADPSSSESMNWLGRAYGRLAETSSAFTAPRHAVKARQAFERAVQLDPNNKEALNDLFEYYISAPGFLGGGTSKAEQLVEKIAKLDAAEGHYAHAQLADKRKDYNAAETQLRRAAELAPKQIGRILDLAKFLAKRGRISESDSVFAHAVKVAPASPRVLFDRAETYVEQKRNLPDARVLLEKYLTSSLTPDDPPRERAQELLKIAKGA